MLTTQQATHLIRRCSFGINQALMEEIQPFTEPDLAVEWLVYRPEATVNYPAWIEAKPPRDDEWEDERMEKMIWRRMERWRRQAKYWWFQEMNNTKNPLQERMVLFWHNHFTSSFEKVHWPPLLLQQNHHFRLHALGNFSDLLAQMLRDPALLIYLDNTSNHKDAPNENLARELLELMTLGEGNYTESDIKNIARALTGASVEWETGEYLFIEELHDDGEKEIFGQVGHFGPEDLPQLILSQPACAEFIVSKLWRELISLTPNKIVIAELAADWQAQDFAIKPLLVSMLTHESFWATANQGNLIKSPIELLVELQHLYQLYRIRLDTYLDISWILQMNLFEPPNVKGWPGGTNWITSETLPMRQNIVYWLGERRMHRKALDNHFIFAVPPQFGGQADRLFEQLLDPTFQVK